MFERNEIVILGDGRIFKVLSNVISQPEDKTRVQFIDRDAESYIDTYGGWVVTQTLNDPIAVLNFHLARSIHLRMNRAK